MTNMVFVPICLRFGRKLVNNASHLSNTSNRAVRMSSSMCYSQWSAKYDISFCHQKFMSSTAAEEKSEQAQQASSTDSTESKGDKTNEQIKVLTQEVENLTQQNKELTDKYKRALADGENLRLRLTKQIEDAKLFGIQGFCKDLLEVADILGKATECVPKEEVSDSNPHLKNLYEGLTMTEAQLQKVFKRHGLIPVNPLNEKFDPNLHEALFQQEVEGKQPGTVVVVSKIGYKLHERVVRPALVGVAKAS